MEERSLSGFKSEFDRLAEISAQLTIDLVDAVSSLKKKQLERVFLATMEYPTPPTKEFVSQIEVDVYNMATGLKEMQLRTGVVNMAIKELEKDNGN